MSLTAPTLRVLPPLPGPGRWHLAARFVGNHERFLVALRTGRIGQDWFEDPAMAPTLADVATHFGDIWERYAGWLVGLTLVYAPSRLSAWQEFKASQTRRLKRAS